MTTKLRKSNRQGAAVVEMAICLPVLITLTVATIDVCSVMFLKESLSIAAYEGARVGIARGGTNELATARVKEILNERGIQYSNSDVVQIQRTNSPTSGGFNSAETLEHCRVRVRVPASGNVLSPAKLFTSGNIESFVWMRKEYANLD
ncbi:TadE family protein [Rosistilla carotiformis]|uniref:TadE family protein n=1 Tax=Rosistilla carotiformis TaxID=2528017 RepID=UPI0018D239D5|nr:TadE family protein [Rosistilla carotiformis]